MKRPKILKTKVIYQDGYSTVKKLTVKKPDGKIHTRAQMTQRAFVIVVAINSKKQLLLSKEYRTNLKKIVWGVPTGYTNTNEIPKQTARRELLEETAFSAKKLIPLYQLTGSSGCQQKGYAFLATQLSKNGNQPELKVYPTSFSKAKELALKNKLGDRIGLVVIAAIEKFKELSKNHNQ